MAEDWSSLPHISTFLLWDLQQRVKDVEPGDGRAALNEVYKTAVTAISESKCCSSHVRLALQVAKEAIFKNVDLRYISTEMKQQIMHLGCLALELFRARHWNMLLWGKLESTAWVLMSLAAFWTPCTKNMPPQQSHHTINWIVNVFGCRRHCPNPYLRLQMIRFMLEWPDQLFKNRMLGSSVLHGLMDLTPYITLNDMLPQGRPSLSGPFASLLQKFHRWGYLDNVSVVVSTQIITMSMGKEVRFFAHVVRLMGEKAKVLRYKCLNASMQCQLVMDEYRFLLVTLKALAASDSCKEAFKLPGLRQLGAIAITAAAINLYKSASRLIAADEDSFRSLTATLDSIFLKVQDDNEYLHRELMCNYGRVLRHASRLADEVGLPLESLQMYKEPEFISERFLDDVTGKIMDDPVLVISSRVVIDISTLVVFMLFSSGNPSFIPYIQMLKLQRRIVKWKLRMMERRLKERRRDSRSDNNYGL